MARNQRSLSVIKGSEEHDQPYELCPHRTHLRFEALKTLNLSHNQLNILEIFVPSDMRNDLNKLNFKEISHQVGVIEQMNEYARYKGGLGTGQKFETPYIRFRFYIEGTLATVKIR